MGYRSFRPVFCLTVLILSALLLCNACSGGDQTADIRYTYGETLLYETSVDSGSPAPDYIPQMPGLRFIAWLDADGNTVVPSEIPATGNMVFSAVMRPALSRHEPYLQCDSYGFIHPDSDLTCGDLVLAVQSLLSEDYPDADALLASLPNGETPVTAETLRNVLALFFTGEELDPVLIRVSEPVSRASFAVILNALCGRTEASVYLSEISLRPVDLPLDHIAYADVLEAAVPHTVSASGSGWQELSLDSGYAPGYFLIEGQLYCCDESGTLLRDCQLGPLSFASDGRYTSGDESLDQFVTEIIAELQSSDPDAEFDTLLRAAYDYVKDSFRYIGRNQYPYGASGWEIEDAKIMFDTGLGNCFNYTAAFWALARGLGYPAYTICIPLGSESGIHAWVDMEIDGTAYIFDPQLEWYFQNNRYMLSYEDGIRYGYRRPYSPDAQNP